MIGWILTRPLALLTGVAGGAAASQVPTFHNSYLTYLQGRLDEASRTAEIADKELNRTATTFGVETPEQLKSALASGEGLANTALQQSVKAWEALIERADWLQSTVTSMVGDAPFVRLLKLPTNLRPEFVQGTMKNFEPGFAFTIESAVLVLSLAMVAYFIARLIARLFWRIVRPNKGKTQASEA